MSDLENKLLEEQLDWFQIQRHDFMNNFQVIRGYLQLNMTDKAIGYMDEIFEEIKPQQDIYQIAHKTMTALLLGMFFGLRLQGIAVKIEIPKEMRQTAFWDSRWQPEYAEDFYGYTKDCLEELPQSIDPGEMTAVIQLSPADNGFCCDFNLYNKSELHSKKNFCSK